MTAAVATAMPVAPLLVALALAAPVMVLVMPMAGAATAGRAAAAPTAPGAALASAVAFSFTVGALGILPVTPALAPMVCALCDLSLSLATNVTHLHWICPHLLPQLLLALLDRHERVSVHARPLLVRSGLREAPRTAAARASAVAARHAGGLPLGQIWLREGRLVLLRLPRLSKQVLILRLLALHGARVVVEEVDALGFRGAPIARGSCLVGDFLARALVGELPGELASLGVLGGLLLLLLPHFLARLEAARVPRLFVEEGHALGRHGGRRGGANPRWTLLAGPV